MVLRSDKVGSGKTKRIRNKTGEYFDYNIIIIVSLLVIFGLIMIYSTSSYNAMNEYGDAYHYLKKQGIAIIAGIAAMIFTIFFPSQLLCLFKLTNHSQFVHILFIFL